MNRHSSSLLAALCIGAAALVAGVAGCSSDGKQREPSDLKTIEQPAYSLKPLWHARIGGGSRGLDTGLRLSVESDAVFAAEAGGDAAAYDPATGKLIWRVDTRTRLVSGPSVSGNALFLGGMDGTLLALKRNDGSPYWSVRLASEVLSAPASDGTLVVARSGDGKVYGLSAVSGAQHWMIDRSVPSLILRGLGEPLLAGGLVFAGFDNGRVVAARMTDGQAVWEQAVASPVGRTELDRLVDVDAGLLLDGQELYAVSYGNELAKLDGASGEILWRRSIRSYTGMARVGELVVVSDADGVIWGLDPASGAAAWKNEDLKYRPLSPPADWDGQAVVGDFKGYLHLLDPRDGRIVARLRVGSDAMRSAPQVIDDRLYVMNTAGRITALSRQAVEN